jgi:hypothetical protein
LSFFFAVTRVGGSCHGYGGECAQRTIRRSIRRVVYHRLFSIVLLCCNQRRHCSSSSSRHNVSANNELAGDGLQNLANLTPVDSLVRPVDRDRLRSSFNWNCGESRRKFEPTRVRHENLLKGNRDTGYKIVFIQGKAT